MLIMPIKRRYYLQKTKHTFSKLRPHPIETKSTQFPEVGPKASITPFSLVNQYIIDSHQLLTYNKHTRLVTTTSSHLKSFSISKAFNASTSTQQVATSPNDYLLKASFSNKIIPYGSHCQSNEQSIASQLHSTSSSRQLFMKRRKKVLVYNEKRKVHDINVFNRVNSDEDPNENYVRNAYKAPQMIQSSKFLNRIRLDLKSLKFKNELKVVNN